MNDSGDLNLDLDPGLDLYDGATSEESVTDDDDDGGVYFSLYFHRSSKLNQQNI